MTNPPADTAQTPDSDVHVIPADGTRSEPKHVQVDRINASRVWAMWSVFTIVDKVDGDRDKIAQDAQAYLDSLKAKGVTVRGTYHLSGMRAEADLMVWMHGENLEELQRAYTGFLATDLGRHLEPYWSNVAMHRVAEFNRGHIPAFMADETPKKYICVYPFVRSYDWYLLPDDERKKMLHDHGMAAREYPDVRANTIASFGLGDYEWILAFECDEMYRILDLMREMRYTEARRHVREETPFFSGPQITMADFVAQMR